LRWTMRQSLVVSTWVHPFSFNVDHRVIEFGFNQNQFRSRSGLRFS
jgi:hypothetical protein